MNSLEAVDNIAYNDATAIRYHILSHGDVAMAHTPIGVCLCHMAHSAGKNIRPLEGGFSVQKVLQLLAYVRRRNPA